MNVTVVAAAIAITALIGFMIWVAVQAKSGAKVRADHAEEKQREAEVTLEQAEAFDKSYRAARGRSLARLRDRLRRKKTELG